MNVLYLILLKLSVIFFKYSMKNFVTFQEILESKWSEPLSLQYPNKEQLPRSLEWTQKTLPDHKEINLWETIFYQPGSIGIYAAWDPYVEIYIVTYNLFLNLENSVKILKGPTACKEIVSIADQAGISLPMHKVWISDENLWQYQ